jgi:hypothetical protein
MHCAICHHAIQPAAEPIISTTAGGFVHISCADREAGRAYRWRTFRAAISATLALSLLGLAIQPSKPIFAERRSWCCWCFLSPGMCASTRTGGV